MTSASTLSFEELNEALTARFVLNLTMIHVTMAMGILLFGVITCFLFFKPDPSGVARGMDGVRILSLVHLGIACGTYAMAPVLFGTLIDRTAQAAKSASAALTGLQVAYIARLALLEGAAMLGLVIFFLMDRSMLSEHPAYSLNLVTPVLFLLFVAATFPTRERLEDLLRERFLRMR